MNATYGARWRANFPDKKSLDIGRVVWGQKLAGLTDRQLRRGVDACAMLAEWNPSIAEFIRAACKLPSLNQCISRVIDQNNIDPVSYRVSAKIGGYALRTMSIGHLKSSIRAHYEDCYEEVLNEVIGSDEEFKPAASLPETVVVETEPADPEVVSSNIEKMRRAIGLRGKR